MIRTVTFVLLMAFTGSLNANDSTIDIISCDSLGVTTSELNTSASQIASGLSNFDDDSLGYVVRQLGEKYNCTINNSTPLIFRDGFEPIAALVEEKTTSSNCATNYCENVRYCGRGSSQTNMLTFSGSSLMNRTCFEHDRCYQFRCVPGACAFAQNSNAATACDSPMLTYCNQSGLSVSDNMICAAVRAIRLVPRLPICAIRNCDGQFCNASLGTCEDFPGPNSATSHVLVLAGLNTGVGYCQAPVGFSINGSPPFSTNLCIIGTGITSNCNFIPCLVGCTAIGYPFQFTYPCN